MVKAINKKILKDMLKEWLDNWKYSQKANDIYYDQDSTFSIKYNNGDHICISEMFYNGEKIKLQGITNIYMSCSECNMDYYYNWIGDKELFETFNELGYEIPKDHLIVNDMEDYFKNFELKEM